MASKKCSPDTSSRSVLGKRGISESDTDSSSDDSKGNKKKIKQNKEDTDSDDGSIINVDKMTKSESYKSTSISDSYVSSLSRTDTESPVNLNGVSKYTSDWTDKVFPSLRLKVQQVDVDALTVLSNGYLYFVEQSKRGDLLKMFTSRNEEDKAQLECYEYALQHVFDLDCDHVNKITFDTLRETTKQALQSSWVDDFISSRYKYAGGNKVIVRERFCWELSRHLKKFMTQLINIVHRLDSEGNDVQKVTEGMYRALFVSFAEILDLNVLSCSNVDKFILTMNGQKIFAVPDALITHPTVLDKKKVGAVVQVKKYRQDEVEAEENRHLRGGQKHTIPLGQHIGSDLRGQHGGQVLCALPSSIFGTRGIFGIIVQGTIVTLTNFKPDECYFENLCSGFLRKKGAVIEYSKQCNILKKEGRWQLAQTLFDMKKVLEHLPPKKFTEI